MAVGAAQIGPVCIASAIAVLDPPLGLIHRARSHVDADIGLGSQRPAVLEELVGAEAVGLLGTPCELHAPRPFFPRAYPICPVIATDEVAAWPAQHRNPERLGRLQHVLSEPALVAER